ncbi:hypothetical protein B0A50_00622 [Salinomyces thailandicus]|uniref:tRNA nucleotidyltransferase n=1 Tax=Salinomyces thailandicus TaxID=706561 RepID=A0A4U0UGJ7_9PEZI|nr:hypothetical protein B0A50_00622 [Salinomyces thailandica]
MAPALIEEVEDASGPAVNLALTPVEATLRELLLDVAKFIDENPAAETQSAVKLTPDLATQPITLRFTGGWVRDKLLGVQSHDIDVAINKLTGYHFGLRLKEYLEQPGNLSKYGLEDIASNDKQSAKAGTTDRSKTVGGLHKIEANPEKSKHLETTTMRILGLDIDLVNLRKETYTEDSRNPQMEFGTPEEDALRRDATVNSMFYNVNTQEIEDFTGRGFQDMEAKIIRTPLEPYQTFKDDPLRVLRLIRFASRLGYSIDQKALVAMKDQEIKDALRRKISRERVGVEMEKALRGPDPYGAMRLVSELGLYETIFSDPTVETVEHYRPETEGWRMLVDYLRDTLSVQGPLSDILVRDDEERFIAWQLAALVPYRDAPQPPPAAPGRRPPPPVAATVAREGVKATNKVTDIVTAAVKAQEEISSLVDRFNDRKRRPEKLIEGDDPMARDVLGMAIRRWGASWRSLVMYSLLVDATENLANLEGKSIMKRDPSIVLTSDLATEKKYKAFIQHLQDLGLLDAYALKPLLDGKTLAKALSTPPGPWMKDALDVVVAWQLRNPGGTDTDEAINEVKAKRGELPSALARHFLKLTIRPLFQKSRPKEVSEMGRKKDGTVLPEKLSMQSTREEHVKPWKSAKEAHSVDLLKWVVTAVDTVLLEELWHLIVPPLLTLVDDWEVGYKTMGAQMLNVVLEVTPPLLLERTGLGDVLEQALMPCLHYLPTVTPESDSINLLNAVHPALITLSHVRFPKDPPPSIKQDASSLKRQRVKFLDSVLREGILHGYEHCSHYPRIVTVVFMHLMPLLNELGIESVKHLKYTLPIITSTLSHPILATQTETLLSANRAMQSVVLNGWPRMSDHRGEVLKGTTMCWLNINGRTDSEAEALRTETRRTVEILCAALGANSGFEKDCETLIAADERLKGLLLP